SLKGQYNNLIKHSFILYFKNSINTYLYIILIMGFLIVSIFACRRFFHLRGFHPDELNISTDYDFHSNGEIKDYCPNAEFVWLFEQHIVSRIYKLGYNNFKEFIKENECLMNIGINDISKFYDPFKILYNMYIEHNGNKSKCTKCCKKKQFYVPNFEDNSEVTSSDPSVVSRLIPVLLIYVVTLILLGISYKYSLFGFRKRSPKQHLREKLKK
ncbi:putative yir3 protein, partial [Plasmodium yoelii yoelii]